MIIHGYYYTLNQENFQLKKAVQKKIILPQFWVLV